MNGRAFAPPPSLLANRPRRRRGAISLTPLIDVVFILIVFFMLASSFSDWHSVMLDAPVRSSGASAADGAFVVELRPDGILLSGEAVTAEQVVARLGSRLARTPDRRVLLKSAAGVSVQDLVALVDRLAAGGITNLSLVGGGAE